MLDRASIVVLQDLLPAIDGVDQIDHLVNCVSQGRRNCGQGEISLATSCGRFDDIQVVFLQSVQFYNFGQIFRASHRNDLLFYQAILRSSLRCDYIIRYGADEPVVINAVVHVSEK